MSLQNYLKDHAVVLWSPILYPSIYQDSHNRWILPGVKFDQLHIDKSLVHCVRSDGVESFLSEYGTIFRSVEHDVEKYPYNTAFECRGYRFFYPEALQELINSEVYVPKYTLPNYPGADFPDTKAVHDFLAMLKQRQKQEEDKLRRHKERYDLFVLGCLGAKEPCPELIETIGVAWSFDVFYDMCDDWRIRHNREIQHKKILGDFKQLGLNAEPFENRFKTRFDKKE